MKEPMTKPITMCRSRWLSRALVPALALAGLLGASELRAQTDEAAEDLPDSEDLRAEDDDDKRYFLIGPRRADGAGDADSADDAETKPPKDGYRLLLVMPGGDGGADFHMFVKRIAQHATDERWLVAQLVAPVWSAEQAETVVWPTAESDIEEQKFTTEEFLAAVIRDVEARHKVDPKFVFTLSWSSSGPAAYAASLDEDSLVTGSFIAMSVFKPDQLPSLKRARGHAYYLLHSPQDFIPIAMAENAEKQLSKNGAKVELAKYEGGHGWRGNVYGNMRDGLAWLEEHHAKPPKRKPRKAKPAEPAAPADGEPEAPRRK